MNPFMKTRGNNSMSALNGRTVHNISCNEVKKVVDKVRKHVCGHASFSDFKILIDRNNIWDFDVEDYERKLIINCRSCQKSSLPCSYRKMSISILPKDINESFCTDHCYLNNI